MRNPTRRVGAVCALTVLASTVVIGTIAAPASASLPAPLAVSETAARTFGDGGPADQALVNSGPLAKRSDGTVVFYDRVAHEIRVIDPVSNTVTVLAGTGSAPGSNQHCSLDVTVPATETPIEGANNLWIDSTGDVYLWLDEYSSCGKAGDVYRLDAADGHWHLALTNPVAPCCALPGDRYSSIAIDPSGNAYVYDRIAYVIRKINANSAPGEAGTVVAGQSGNPGEDGDGGPATAARLGNVGFLVAPGDGSFAFTSSGGYKIRRVDATGTISVVAGTGSVPPSPTADVGSPATSARLSIGALLVSAGPTQLYVLNQAGTSAALLAFTYGGTLRTVVGPAGVTSVSPLDHCPGNGLGGMLELTTPGRLLISCGYGIRSWPSDGAAATQAGTRVAGVDDATGAPSSPDGTALSHAYLSGSAMALAPSGQVAVGTPSGIRLLSGITDSDTVSTLVPNLNASPLGYATDGTLVATIALYAQPTKVVRISPAGVVTTVLGGGSAAVGQDVPGTDVALNGYYFHVALDPSTGALYVNNLSGQIWRLDPTTGLLDLFAGNNQSWDPVEGESAKTAALGSSAMQGGLGFDPTTGAVYFSTSQSANVTGTLGRIDSDGTLHVVRCYVLWSGCGSLPFQVGPDGLLRFDGANGMERMGADGTKVQDAPGFSGRSLILPDDRLVKLGSDPAGGLLQITAIPPAPVFAGAPSVSVAPGDASVHVSVTPVAGRAQLIKVLATEIPSNGHEPLPPTLLTSVYSDGTLPAQSLTFYKLDNTGFLAGHQYLVTVVAGENDAAAKVSASSAPQSVVVEPLPEAVAPAAPSLSLNNGGTSVTVTVGMPSDPDLENVIVRVAESEIAPSTPAGGDAAATLYPGNAIQVFGRYGLSSLKPYAFAAFAIDTSGNVSAAATAVRPAAVLVTGAAATNVAFMAGPGYTTITPATGAGMLSYAPGTTPPMTPLDGTAIHGWVCCAPGPIAHIPVANGAKVAVSIFAYTDDTMTAYRRTSFVLTGGVNGDTAALTATTSVNYGSRPTVTTTLTRVFATGGSQRITGKAVDLYRRPVGSSTWSKVSTVTTGSTGVASFLVPVPTRHVDYQVRSAGIDGTTILSPVRRTSVRQLLTLTQSATSVRHGYAVTLAGVVTPKRSVRIYLQRYVSGKWVNLTYVLSASTGYYRFSYKPSTVGTYYLRTYVSATTSLATGISPTRVLKAT